MPSKSAYMFGAPAPCRDKGRLTSDMAVHQLLFGDKSLSDPTGPFAPLGVVAAAPVRSWNIVSRLVVSYIPPCSPPPNIAWIAANSGSPPPPNPACQNPIPKPKLKLGIRRPPDH